MQMSMVVYSMIDVLAEKQKVSGKDQKQAEQSQQKPFLGLMQECFMSQY